MKAIAYLFLFFTLWFPSVSGQSDFKVIKVNGSILLRTRGVSLETGTVFSEKEDLLFRTEDATAAVINPQRGRLVLTSSNHDLASAKSNYLPSMYNISSRAAKLLTASEISEFFTGRFVVLDKHATLIDDVAFPMNKNNFFFLRYTFRGQEINKKLSFDGNAFFIDKKTLLSVDGSPIPSADNTKIRLYYRRGKESVFLSEFDLIFPDIDKLADETKIIMEAVSAKPKVDKIAEVGAYITEMYGRIPGEDLEKWLGERFGIK